jgi:CIC family chloride channel protein
MGTAFAGVIRTPLTSVVMIFEVTRDYTIIVPVMISNLIAFYISQRLQREPVYDSLAHQDGLHLPTSTRARRGTLRVIDAVQGAPESLSPDTPMSVAAERVKDAGLTSWPVADDDGLVGMVRVRHITTAMDKGRNDMTVARLMQIAARRDGIKYRGVPHVHNDQPLSQALARMGDTGHKVLPVVSRANVRIMLGVVTLPDILDVYGVESADDLDYTDHPDV